jgi:hypothetical protein
MNSTAVMPMPMPITGSVAPAPYARVRVPWQSSVAPVSAGFGLGLGSSFACVTTTDHLNQATEINTKAHGARRLPETST